MKKMVKLVILLLAAVFLFGSFSGRLYAASPKVTIKIGKKDVTRKTCSLTAGTKAALKVSVTGLKGKKKIKYSSSNKKIAAVTSKGVVTGKKSGAAKISVSVTSGKKKADTWVTFRVVKKTAAGSSTPGSDTKQPHILVVYFSCTNTTKTLAEYAADYLNADLYRIEPENPYSKADLDYNASNSRANREQNDPAARPAISGGVKNMAQYDTVVLGYPIWHSQAPRIISSFLERYDFSGKTILPFCTSHSSGIGSSDDALHQLASGAKWLNGKRFSSGSSKKEIETWLNENGVKPVASAKVGAFDFKKKTVLLNSGYEMPIMGLGTYSLTDEECYNSVTALLESGGRLIDTAYMYGNDVICCEL